MPFSSARLLQRLIQFAFLGLFLAPALLIATIVAPGPLHENKNIVIAKGAHTKSMAEFLSNNGVIWHPLAFRIAARVLANGNLKAGEYAFTPKQSIASIIDMMHEGHYVIRKFTLPEGLTSAEAVDLLNKIPALTGSVTAIPADGSLLPETYNYTYGDSRAETIARMQNMMQETVGKLWEERDTTAPVTTPQEALVLASIVEKETGKKVERSRIAAVFYNRLKFHMRLQSDPTVIYALTKGYGLLNRPLTHKDMAFPSPYNTYVSDGLPPAPICNPGKAALEAVLHPETNDYLYFVADGTGGHAFARNLAEHNANVAKWARLQAGK